MVYVLADNIISPLGETSEENYQAVKAGRSAIHAYIPMTDGIPDGFMASLLSSNFEDLVFKSAKKAIEVSDVDVSDKRTIFILSSTKGTIEQLGKIDDKDLYLGETALRVSRRLGFKTKPIVVCNACISGLAAIILACRLLQLGTYDKAVVCGADCPGRFIISGFQSLNAMSPVSCRPFDIERQGLNIGEAAATMVLSNCNLALSNGNLNNKRVWQLSHGYVKNDSFHISAPSKTADGLCDALRQTLEGIDINNVAFINAHGTATLFNDQMEAVALKQTGLTNVPINALKGYIGHTLGAAGIFETILSMKAVDDHTILGTRGYEELGVSGNVLISSNHYSTEKSSFIKMLSGFGGCNATIYAKLEDASYGTVTSYPKVIDNNLGSIKKAHQVLITPKGVWLDGNACALDNENNGHSLLTAIYKKYIGNYPKYYKMDGLCRLGFVASELLLQVEKTTNKLDHIFDKERAIMLFNRSSSISSDKRYLSSISDKDNYFPSPSVFVYTLPNIVTGEIAIRNNYHGETSFYILPRKDEEQMQTIIETAFVDKKTKSLLTGWLDYEDSKHFEADLSILYVS